MQSLDDTCMHRMGKGQCLRCTPEEVAHVKVADALGEGCNRGGDGCVGGGGKARSGSSCKPHLRCTSVCEAVEGVRAAQGMGDWRCEQLDN